MAKLTDPEIIQALKDGKSVDRYSIEVPYPIFYDNKEGYLCGKRIGTVAVLDMEDIEAPDWGIELNQPINQ